MANNEMKTNAEIYREQRKERLAKAAKKKSHTKRDKAIGIIVKVACILVALTFVLGYTGRVLTNFVQLPQKVLTAATYGDTKLTVAEYNYYYMSIFNNAISTAQYYDSQYQGFGATYFDTSKDPAEQDYPGEDVPEDVKTWADYFEYRAAEQGILMKVLYEKAMADKGFKVTDEQRKELDEALTEVKTTLEEQAKDSNLGIDVYVAKKCGEGLNLERYLELAEKDQIVNYYTEWYKENCADNISDDELDKYYTEHKDELDIASIRYFAVIYKAEGATSESTVKYTEAEAKARVEEFASKITDENSFIDLALEYAEKENKDAYKEADATLQGGLTKSGLSQLSEEFANWMFDGARKYGDVEIFKVESQSAYYIAYIVEPASKNAAFTSADVRHLLVKAETKNADGKDLSTSEVNKNFAEAKKEAEALLEQWKAGDKSEESFAALVKEHTDDAGSKENGGLYEGVTNDGKYVAEFTNWSLEPHKPGDTGIVKTTYGYHIMYLVSGEGAQWEADTRNAIANEKYTQLIEGINDDVSKNIVRGNEKILEFFADRELKIINKYFIYG